MEGKKRKEKKHLLCKMKDDRRKEGKQKEFSYEKFDKKDRI